MPHHSCATPADGAEPQRNRHSRGKALGLIVGAGAVLAAAAVTLSHSDYNAGDGISRGVASGNHNATFTPPNVPVMNMGGTVVSTTPSNVLPTEKAAPQVKAGH